MASMASNRAVSATVLLSLLVTGWCVPMASAVPVANGRRLQQFADSGGLARQLQALMAALAKLSGQMQSALQPDDLLSSLQDQMERVADSFDVAQGKLRINVERLLSLPTSMLDQPDNQNIVQDLLTELKTSLQEILTLFRNPQPDADGCFKTQKDFVLAKIRDLTSKLKSATDGPMQPQDLITALGNLGDAVDQVDPCAAGLESLRSSKGPEVLATLDQLLGAFY